MLWIQRVLTHTRARDVYFIVPKTKDTLKVKFFDGIVNELNVAVNGDESWVAMHGALLGRPGIRSSLEPNPANEGRSKVGNLMTMQIGWYASHRHLTYCRPFQSHDHAVLDFFESAVQYHDSISRTCALNGKRTMFWISGTYFDVGNNLDWAWTNQLVCYVCVVHGFVSKDVECKRRLKFLPTFLVIFKLRMPSKFENWEVPHLYQTKRCFLHWFQFNHYWRRGGGVDEDWNSAHP